MRAIGLKFLMGGIPEPPTATDATSIEDDKFTANWSSVSSATSYRLDVSEYADFRSFVGSYNNYTVNGTSQAVTGLTAGTNYYYRVRAVNAAGSSADSNTISQTTYTAEAQAYFDACPTTVSTARKAAINQLIISLKASKNGSDQSIWDLTDKLGILANESIGNAAINIKYPTKTDDADGLGTLQYVTADPTMAPNNAGLLRNDVGNNHIYTRYKPEGNYNYKIDSATVAIWVLQAETEAYKTNMGTSIAASGNVCLRAQRKPDLNTVAASINSATFDYTHTLSPETGFFGVVRTSQTKISVFQNTTKLVNQTSNRDALPNSIIALSGVYNSETLYSTKPLCFYFIGGGLTDGNGGQMESLRSAMAAYLTTMGVI